MEELAVEKKHFQVSPYFTTHGLEEESCLFFLLLKYSSYFLEGNCLVWCLSVCLASFSLSSFFLIYFSLTHFFLIYFFLSLSLFFLSLSLSLSPFIAQPKLMVIDTAVLFSRDMLTNPGQRSIEHGSNRGSPAVAAHRGQQPNQMRGNCGGHARERAAWRSYGPALLDRAQ